MELGLERELQRLVSAEAQTELTTFGEEVSEWSPAPWGRQPHAGSDDEPLTFEAASEQPG